MNQQLKESIKRLSRKNWLFYKLLMFAQNFYGCMGGGKSNQVGLCEIEEKYYWQE